MHSIRKGEQISEKFSQLLSQSLCYWSLFCFSDLPLKGATPKLPSLNARILGVLRFSYNPNLVGQCKTSSQSTGEESTPWSGSSAEFLRAFRTLRARDVSLCVCVCPYPGSWAFCVAQNRWAHSPNPVSLLGSLFWVHGVNQHSTAHISSQISPDAADPFP